MKRERLGCLTGSGIIAGILTVLIVTGIGLAKGGGLFSPGALNAQAGQVLGGVSAHAETGGECRLCHAAFWSVERMSDRCVDCHTDIPFQRFDPQSLHGILFEVNPGLACRACHPEHRGAFAALTDMSLVDFPHERVGFSLAGHPRLTDGAPFGCNDCHLQNYTQFDQAVCLDCHDRDDALFTTAHSLEFGNDCLACHDGVDRYGDDFDHNRFPFPLTGRHVGAPCSGCHLDARSIPDLQSAPQDCFSCHGDQDPHQGRYGNDCGACHTTLGWSPASFDHNLSVFKLEGLHAQVDCEGCHVNRVFVGTPTDCYSCHAADDEHDGRYGTNCAACHTPAGWLPATVDHNLFAFKLEGRHVNVACESCHINNVFQGTPTTCYACHAGDDEHAGSFGTGCGACHTVNGWLPASFDHSRFPLTNGHAGLPCTRCHTVPGIYTGLSSACANCHADPAFHAGLFSSNCAQCHNTRNWSASYNGPHPNTCDGQCIGHEGAGCRDCHTANLNTATCTRCHDSNNPGDD
jgi:hypothetical protein